VDKEMTEPVKIPQKIKGWAIKKEDTTIEEVKEVIAPIIVTKERTKLERGDVLYGATYKIKQPQISGSFEHGFYLTINSTQVNEQLIPFEIFIESKNSECTPLLKVLSHTITAMFRLQIDINFLLDEYSTVQDANGGYRGKKHFWEEKPKFYNSLVGEIAEVIRYHLSTLNTVENTPIITASAYLARAEEPDEDVPLFEVESKIPNAIECPSCHSISYILMDGCYTCVECSHSKCG
jgi:hypothetical protein